MQLCTSFFHGLKMCMWFGFNPAVNFCHFSTLLTLSFFNFSQVRHQLHRSSIYILIDFSIECVIFSYAYANVTRIGQTFRFSPQNDSDIRKLTHSNTTHSIIKCGQVKLYKTLQILKRSIQYPRVGHSVQMHVSLEVPVFRQISAFRISCTIGFPFLPIIL